MVHEQYTVFDDISLLEKFEREKEMFYSIKNLPPTPTDIFKTLTKTCC